MKACLVMLLLAWAFYALAPIPFNLVGALIFVCAAIAAALEAIR
jgi:hypothetical protein